MKLPIVAKSVNDFFFKPQGVQSVALMRICFGLLLLANWVMVWSHLDVFWGVDGLFSLETSLKYASAWRFSLFDWMPNDPRVPVIVAGLNLIGAIGVTFGLFTRTSIAIAFLTLVSFHNRNIFILNSADLILRNLLFFMFFSASGYAYSLDRWILLKRGLAPKEPLERAPWALRLIQIQFSLIYIATVMFKMKGVYWADGTAVYIATRLDEFLKFSMPMILNNLLLIKLLTWGTLVVEFSLGTLVWVKELRYWVLLAGVGLHVGIEVTMNIPLFEIIMIAAMLCMVDSADIKRCEDWLRSKLNSSRQKNMNLKLSSLNS
ncbi:Vitamin K-dependent gamma-carboxylase [compost metagenome]